MEEKERQSGRTERTEIGERWNEKSKEGHKKEGIKMGRRREAEEEIRSKVMRIQ